MSLDSDTEKSGRDLFRLIAFIMLAQASALFIRSWLQVTLEGQGIATWPAKNLSYLVMPPMLLVLLYPVWRNRLAALGERFGRQGLTIRIVAIGVTLGIAARFATVGSMIGFAGFGWAFDPEFVAAPMVSFSCPSIALAVLHIFVTAMLTPLIEEIINRAWFLQWLRQYGNSAAIGGSALLFAILHDPQAMATAFIFGLFLGKLFLNTRTLWSPIIAHAAFNSLIVLDWYCLHVTWSPAATTATTRSIGALGLSLTLVALGFCVLVVSQRVTGTSPDDSQT